MWIEKLFFGEGIAHSVIILALTISIGIALGKMIKIKGITIGMTWILFLGILFSHFGLTIEAHLLHFIKEFGLILFVYAVGMQVGPGFFASFRKGGVTLNMLAAGVVVLGVVTAYLLHLATGLDITTMVGILSGAVTNTPGLGAAEQTLVDITGSGDETIALGYAVAYPLGVTGIIGSIIAMRYIFGVNMAKEDKEVEKIISATSSNVTHFSVEVKNPAIFGRSIYDITRLIDKKFVISRISHGEDSVEIADSKSILNEGDKLLMVCAPSDIDAVAAFLGEKIVMSRSIWSKINEEYISRRIVITNPKVNGKSIADLSLRSNYGVNVTRVSRVGVELVANAALQLQLGDKVLVVGTSESVDKVSKALGNSVKHLREPNLFPIFLGIALGVLVGSIPFMFPGIPQPVKLGLAGGPLIVAILVSRFGPKYKLVTYTSTSASLMLREIGIAMFLAAVGLGAGGGFVDTIVNRGGYMWVFYGIVITVVPLLIMGAIARYVFKINYYTMMGLLAGSTTDPPALAYSNTISSNDLSSVSYATVYPLTMFLRVLTAQLMILLSL